MRSAWLVLLVVACALSGPAGADSGVRDLLSGRGDFERIHDGAPVGWQLAGDAIAPSTDHARNGATGLRVTVGPGTGDHLADSGLLLVWPGESYALRADARVTGAVPAQTAGVAVVYATQDGDYAGSATFDFSTAVTDGWATRTTQSPAPVNAMWARIVVFMDPANADADVAVDNVRFVGPVRFANEAPDPLAAPNEAAPREKEPPQRAAATPEQAEASPAPASPLSWPALPVGSGAIALGAAAAGTVVGVALWSRRLDRSL